MLYLYVNVLICSSVVPYCSSFIKLSGYQCTKLQPLLNSRSITGNCGALFSVWKEQQEEEEEACSFSLPPSRPPPPPPPQTDVTWRCQYLRIDPHLWIRTCSSTMGISASSLLDEAKSNYVKGNPVLGTRSAAAVGNASLLVVFLLI